METHLNASVPRASSRITVSAKGHARGERTRVFSNTLTVRAFSLLYGTSVIGSDISTTKLSNVFRYITLGSGSGAIDYMNATELETPTVERIVDTELSQSTETINSETFHIFRLSYRFAEGAYTGTLSEIGAKDNVAPYTLTAGTAIVDENGQPSPIDVLVDDVLDIKYEILFPVNAWTQPEQIGSLQAIIDGQTIDVAFTRSAMLNWATPETSCVFKPWWTGRPEDIAGEYIAPVINTLEVPSNQCEATVSVTENQQELYSEFYSDTVVYTAFTATSISNMALFACPQYASAKGTRPTFVTLSFVPAVARASDQQIVIRTRVRLNWVNAQPI